jgi:hypothetical protein
VWRFAFGGRVIEERIWMEPGADTVYVAWRLEAEVDEPAPHLSVSLLANGRDHHGDTWPPGFAPKITADGSGLTVDVANRFSLHITATSGAVAACDDWYRDFDLPVERERGVSARDSHLHVGELELPLEMEILSGFVASIGRPGAPDLDAALERRRAHDRGVLERAIAADPVFAGAPSWVMRLVLATDLYVIVRPLAGLAEGRSVSDPIFSINYREMSC